MKLIKAVTMNAALIVTLVGIIAAIGCRTSDRALDAGGVDSHSYLVVGEVHRPGVVFSRNSLQTLLRLIDSRGGFTENAQRTKVRVIYSGTTNLHNCHSIRDGKLPDPLIPLGATIVVPAVPL